MSLNIYITLANLMIILKKYNLLCNLLELFRKGGKTPAAFIPDYLISGISGL